MLRREEAETKLTKAWTEADQLLIEYSTLSAALADSDGQNARSETSAQARARERAAGKRASRKADRQTILKNMAGLVNTIRGEYDTAHDQMEAMTLATRICLMENGVLQQYEADTWYDANGRIVFTNNRCTDPPG